MRASCDEESVNFVVVEWRGVGGVIFGVFAFFSCVVVELLVLVGDRSGLGITHNYNIDYILLFNLGIHT